ncbi:hypothetical protein RvY_04200-2 [Ramazzottius varieornatus]|uniref:Lysosomal dipeptide transporter MFSD1 n=1 Tax=Ramazzottius varieornatus TaxID=947166 RepID=A0A1D1UQS2_RAMVA|nr:hypothetical protein RvY_04200-2 [Ramazzottius varieornatus]
MKPCLTLFFAQWGFDEMGILASRMSGLSPECIWNNGTDATCLTMTASEFNGLFVAHFWSGTISAIGTGYITGRFGIWIGSLCVALAQLLGMLIFTVGPYGPTTNVAYAVMLIGRIIFGCGFWGSSVVSQQVMSHWFFGRELAMAFSLYTNSIRIASIISFASLGTVAQKYGMQNTMWIVFGLAVLGPSSSVLGGWVYKRFAAISMAEERWLASSARTGISLSLIKKLSWHYWTVAIFFFATYGTLVSILADFAKFLTEARGLNEATAGVTTGIISDIGILSPLLGIVTDRYGWRDIQMIASSTFILTGLLVITTSTSALSMPVIFCVLVGAGYVLFTSSVWSSVVAVTTSTTVGVAMSITTAIQSFSGGAFLLMLGLLLDRNSMEERGTWMSFFVVLAVTVSVALLSALAALYLDRKNILRPLRSKHSTYVPAAAAEMNTAVDEVQPFAKANGSARGGYRYSDSLSSGSVGSPTCVNC